MIAIENVRLFAELKQALEQRTAPSEILRVMSSSPTNMQPGRFVEPDPHEVSVATGRCDTRK